MSIYATLDGAIGEQLASNRGWGDFLRWVEALGDAPQLRCLTEYGWSESLDQVEEQLAEAGSYRLPDEDVRGTVHGLLEVLRDRGEATVMTVTDGMAPVDDEEVTGNEG